MHESCTEKLFRKKFQNISKTTFLIAEKGKWSKSNGGTCSTVELPGPIEIEVPCGVQLRGDDTMNFVALCCNCSSLTMSWVR